MRFDGYFQLDGYTEEEQLIRFLDRAVSIMLRGLHGIEQKLILTREKVLHAKWLSNLLCWGCRNKCAGNSLNRGDVISAPYGLHSMLQNKWLRLGGLAVIRIRSKKLHL